MLIEGRGRVRSLWDVGHATNILACPVRCSPRRTRSASFSARLVLPRAPDEFFRFYLILLSEFVNQLRGLSDPLGLEIGRPPKLVVVWANCWAKHRLHILAQRHPEPIFADEYAENWQAMERALPTLLYEDRCGKQRRLMVIDTAWLCDHANEHKPDLELANGEAKAVIVFPPMQDFLDQTCGYFRHFIDAALKAPTGMRKFQSDHAKIRC